MSSPNPSGPLQPGVEPDPGAAGVKAGLDDKETPGSEEDELALDPETRPDDTGSDPRPNGPLAFGLGSDQGVAHAKWLSGQLAGYTKWYYQNGTMYSTAGTVIQVLGTLTGLAATVLAAAPEDFQDHRIAGLQWHWAIAICSAITTVLSGALPPILRRARDREDGRIEMVRLQQELDILSGGPPIEVYTAAKSVIDRIASVERSYGGSKTGIS